jgi:DNA polymerase-3 subunit delta
VGIDWNAVHNESRSLSLFGGRRILEIRLGEKRPDRTGSAILCELLDAVPDDTLLLISCSRLDRKRDWNSKWVKALDAVGGVVQVWPVPPPALPDWIQQRLADHGLSASAEAATLLAERAEGNMLACAQEVEKLALLHPDRRLELTDVENAVGDSSRFSPFDLTEAITRGQAQRALRILDTLREEGVEPPVLLWALARETRAMTAMAAGRDPGIRMPPQRLKALQQHARRLGTGELNRALARAASVDRAVKGQSPEDPWRALTSVVLRLAGTPLSAGLDRPPGPA